MPIEQREIQPHSVMPKHLFREGARSVIESIEVATSSQQPQAETYYARLCAEPPRATSGLSPAIDGIAPDNGDIVFHLSDQRLYYARSGTWDVLSDQPALGDTVLIGEGIRHAGTLHAIDGDINVRYTTYHASVIVTDYANPPTIDTTPAPVGCATVEVGGMELTSLDPFAYTASHDGLYHVHASVAIGHNGLPDLALWLELFVGGGSVAILDTRASIMTYVHLVGSTLVRLTRGQVLDVRIAADALVGVSALSRPQQARICVTRVR